MLARPWFATLLASLLLVGGLVVVGPAVGVEATGTGSVSGRVLQRGLTGWEDETPSVVAYRRVEGRWHDEAAVTTAANGRYTLGDLPAGDYKVGFSYSAPSGHRYVQVYEGASTLDEGTSVAVTAGGTATGIDGLLERHSSVSGRVTDPQGKPVAGVVVSGEEFFGSPWRSRGLTDSQGRYRLRTEEGGSVRLRFEPSDRFHLDTWWPGIPGAGEEGAVDLVVAPSTDVTGYDVVVRRGGGIAGALNYPNDSAGHPAPTALQRRNGIWTEVATGVTTGLQQGYSIGGLPRGDYRVCFPQSSSTAATCIGGGDVDTAASIRVVVGRTTRRDHAAPRPASITGQIAVASGAPPEEVRVTAYRRTASGYEPVTSTTVGPGVGYELSPLSPGTYRVGFETEGDTSTFEESGTQEFWPNAHSVETGQDISLKPGQVATGRDLATDAGATIEVERRGEFADVSVYRLSATGSWVSVRRNPVTTDTAIEVGGLRPGTYRLGFGVGRPWFTHTVPVYWPDASTVAGARDIVVGSMTDRVTGLSVTVDPGSAIVGSIDAYASGHRQRLRFGDVVAYRKVGDGWVEESRDAPAWRLDGRFALAGLPAGTYRIGFDPRRSFWAPAFHGPMVPRTLAAATDITVPAATDVEGVDILVPARVRAVVAPRITGAARVGRVLRVASGLWTPTGVRFTYQWLTRGQPVRGATGTTYRLRPRDRGARITVRVTGKRGPGFETTAVRTPPTNPVQPRRRG